MRNVLIVDDSRMARLFIRRCLETVGLENITFFEASEGKEALSILTSETMSLVVSDLNMPQMDGKALLQWMNANEQMHDIPVVFVTSTNNPARSKELQDLGAKAVLNKPISPAALAPVMEEFLG